MKEELQNKIIELLKRIYNHNNLTFNFENLETHQVILDQLSAIDSNLLSKLKELFILWESFVFIRTDKMLMFKARDIWKMQMDSMKIDLDEAIVNIDNLLE